MITLDVGISQATIQQRLQALRDPTVVWRDCTGTGSSINAILHKYLRPSDKTKFPNLIGHSPGALSIRPKIPEIPGWGANGTDIFRNFIPKFWEYLARLA